MPQLSKITEFNQALIYGFDAERPLDLNASIATIFQYGDYQFLDIFQAYLYAQDDILSDIRKHGINTITPEKLIAWISGIHQRIAKHMGIMNDFNAGEYIQPGVSIVRYNPNHTIMHGLELALSLPLHQSDDYTEKIGQFLAKKHGADENDLIQFLKVARKYQVKIPASKDKTDLNIGCMTLLDIVNLQQEGQLPVEDYAIIKKIMKVTLRHDQMVIAMNAFAACLIEKWQKCDANDLRQVAELLTYTYAAITEIHPFGNANGRTATCLINILLRAFNLPSIMMRHIEEKEDKQSSYSLAIKGLEQDNTAQLLDHIANRIRDAKEQNEVHDLVLMELFHARMESIQLSELLISSGCQNESEFEKFFADTIEYYTTNNITQNPNFETGKPNKEVSLYYVQYFNIKSIEKLFDKHKDNIKYYFATRSQLEGWGAQIKEDGKIHLWRAVTPAQQTQIFDECSQIEGITVKKQRLTSNKQTQYILITLTDVPLFITKMKQSKNVQSCDTKALNLLK